MWLVFQSLIIFAVVASNIHWHWTPNGYLAAILGAGLAWLLTRLCAQSVAKPLLVLTHHGASLSHTGPIYGSPSDCWLPDLLRNKN
jgi:hypothetical protein